MPAARTRSEPLRPSAGRLSRRLDDAASPGSVRDRGRALPEARYERHPDELVGGERSQSQVQMAGWDGQSPRLRVARLGARGTQERAMRGDRESLKMAPLPVAQDQRAGLNARRHAVWGQELVEHQSTAVVELAREPVPVFGVLIGGEAAPLVVEPSLPVDREAATARDQRAGDRQ